MTDRLYTDFELSQFDHLTNALSSQDQVRRIDARFKVKKFEAEHGKEKCQAMFEELKRRDQKAKSRA